MAAAGAKAKMLQAIRKNIKDVNYDLYVRRKALNSMAGALAKNAQDFRAQAPYIFVPSMSRDGAIAMESALSGIPLDYVVTYVNHGDQSVSLWQQRPASNYLL